MLNLLLLGLSRFFSSQLNNSIVVFSTTAAAKEVDQNTSIEIFSGEVGNFPWSGTGRSAFLTKNYYITYRRGVPVAAHHLRDGTKLGFLELEVGQTILSQQAVR